MFIGRTDAEAETPKLWSPDAKTDSMEKTLMLGRIDIEDEAEPPTLLLPDAKSWLIRKAPDAQKDWGQEEKGATENDVAG